jgi:streptogramin lyase
MANRPQLRRLLCGLIVAGASTVLAPTAYGRARVAYNATCTSPLGCSGFSVLVMDEQGRRTVMAQDCAVCEASIPGASVSYGPRTAGQHTGAFSDDDPAAGRRFFVGLSATGANEPLSFTFRLIDTDGSERGATATLSADPRPIVTQCTPIGSTPPGPPLTVATIGDTCTFAPPAPVATDPLAGLHRLPTRTDGTLTTYDLPSGFLAESALRAADGRIWFAAQNFSNRAFLGNLGPGGDLRIVIDSATTSVPLGIIRGGDGNIWAMAAAREAMPPYRRIQGPLIRVTPAGQITAFPIALPPAMLAEGLFFSRARDLWSISTRGHWTLVRLSTAGTVARLYPTSVRGQVAGMALGPDGAPWIGDAFGRLYRLTRAGRLLRVAVPGKLTRRYVKWTPDGLYFIDLDRRPRVGRVTRDLKVTRTCALASYAEGGLAVTARGVWFALRRTADLALLTPSGEVIQYRNALPGASTVRVVAPGAGGAVVVAYSKGPRANVSRQSGHLARFRPGAGGKRICRTWAR